eukprot:COSAG01_NODE_1403_length_10445_cov_67.595399_7_plen_697_part_00
MGARPQQQEQRRVVALAVALAVCAATLQLPIGTAPAGGHGLVCCADLDWNCGRAGCHSIGECCGTPWNKLPVGCCTNGRCRCDGQPCHDQSDCFRCCDRSSPASAPEVVCTPEPSVPHTHGLAAVVFAELDTDRSSFLDKQELRRLIRPLPGYDYRKTAWFLDLDFPNRINLELIRKPDSTIPSISKLSSKAKVEQYLKSMSQKLGDRWLEDEIWARIVPAESCKSTLHNVYVRCVTLSSFKRWWHTLKSVHGDDIVSGMPAQDLEYQAYRRTVTGIVYTRVDILVANYAAYLEAANISTVGMWAWNIDNDRKFSVRARTADLIDKYKSRLAANQVNVTVKSSAEITIVVDATLGEHTLTVIDGRFPGNWQTLVEGALQFSDRPYILTHVPKQYIGMRYFKGPCKSGSVLLSITGKGNLIRSVSVFASHDVTQRKRALLRAGMSPPPDRIEMFPKFGRTLKLDGSVNLQPGFDTWTVTAPATYKGQLVADQSNALRFLASTSERSRVEDWLDWGRPGTRVGIAWAERRMRAAMIHASTLKQVDRSIGWEGKRIYGNVPYSGLLQYAPPTWRAAGIRLAKQALRRARRQCTWARFAAEVGVNMTGQGPGPRLETRCNPDCYTTACDRGAHSAFTDDSYSKEEQLLVATPVTLANRFRQARADIAGLFASGAIQDGCMICRHSTGGELSSCIDCQARQ